MNCFVLSIWWKGVQTFALQIWSFVFPLGIFGPFCVFIIIYIFFLCFLCSRMRSWWVLFLYLWWCVCVSDITNVDGRWLKHLPHTGCYLFFKLMSVFQSVQTQRHTMQTTQFRPLNKICIWIVYVCACLCRVVKNSRPSFPSCVILCSAAKRNQVSCV